MQEETYRPVPFSVGGVAYAKPAPIVRERAAPAVRFGPEDATGFKPMFFTREDQGTEMETQLRLDWEQAAARMIARAYSSAASPTGRRHLVDLAV